MKGRFLKLMLFILIGTVAACTGSGPVDTTVDGGDNIEAPGSQPPTDGTDGGVDGGDPGSTDPGSTPPGPSALSQAHTNLANYLQVDPTEVANLWGPTMGDNKTLENLGKADLNNLFRFFKAASEAPSKVGKNEFSDELSSLGTANKEALENYIAALDKIKEGFSSEGDAFNLLTAFESNLTTIQAKAAWMQTRLIAMAAFYGVSLSPIPAPELQEFYAQYYTFYSVPGENMLQTFLSISIPQPAKPVYIPKVQNRGVAIGDKLKQVLKSVTFEYQDGHISFINFPGIPYNNNEIILDRGAYGAFDTGDLEFYQGDSQQGYL